MSDSRFDCPTFGDGPELYGPLPSNARYTGYDNDPVLEKLAARFAASQLEDEIASLPLGPEWDGWIWIHKGADYAGRRAGHSRNGTRLFRRRGATFASAYELVRL
jgi:hypothetical protein